MIPTQMNQTEPTTLPQCFEEATIHKPLSYEDSVALLTDQQVLREYDIRIQFLDMGCIVNVGCKAIAFNNTYEAIEKIKDYILNPKEVSAIWRKEFNMG
jgi:hypothetical protein